MRFIINLFASVIASNRNSNFHRSRSHTKPEISKIFEKWKHRQSSKQHEKYYKLFNNLYSTSPCKSPTGMEPNCHLASLELSKRKHMDSSSLVWHWKSTALIIPAINQIINGFFKKTWAQGDNKSKGGSFKNYMLIPIEIRVLCKLLYQEFSKHQFFDIIFSDFTRVIMFTIKNMHIYGYKVAACMSIMYKYIKNQINKDRKMLLNIIKVDLPTPKQGTYSLGWFQLLSGESYGWYYLGGIW